MESSFKAKGSFGIPEQIKQQMEQAKTAPKEPEPTTAEARTAPQAPQADAAAAPVVDEQAKELADRRDKEQAQMAELKTAYEKNLGTAIDEDGVRDYIFKGRLIKEVTIIPGYMKGVMQTLTTKESEEIDERMALIQMSMKKTPQGFDNERAVFVLSYAWTSAQHKNDMRALGTNPTERERTIREMGAHVVDLASEASVQLNFLLKYALREKGFVKKS